MAIETLAYRLVMNHREFTQGAVASRKELNLAKKLMLESRTPAQKYEEALESLGGLLRKGAIDQDTYNKSAQKLKASLEKQEAAAKKAAGGIEKVSKETKSAKASVASALPGFNKFTALLASPAGALAASIGSVTLAAKRLNEELSKERERITQVADAAQKVGADLTSFIALDKATRSAGISTEALTTSLQRSSRKVGDALRGSGEAAKTFNELGLDLDKLSKLEAVDQFVAIQEAIAGLPTHVERLSATVKIFDTEGADLVRVTNLSAEGLAKLRKEVIDTGEAFTQLEADKVRDTNDSLQALEDRVSGVKTQAALGTASLFAQTARDIEDLAKSAKSVPGVDILGQLGDFANLAGAGSARLLFRGLRRRSERLQSERLGTATGGAPIQGVASDVLGVLPAVGKTLDKIEKNTRETVVVEETNIP